MSSWRLGTLGPPDDNILLPTAIQPIKGRNTLENAIRQALSSIQTEDLMVEAMRDLVKDEIKRYIRTKLDENPEIKRQMNEAVRELMDAKAREYYALARLAKNGVELGMEMMPPEMRERLSRDIASLIEKEMNQVFEKM
jgi:adenosyl cobinamide kinase/adenosyl cobinamide phosphate guanylyltransferase